MPPSPPANPPSLLRHAVERTLADPDPELEPAPAPGPTPLSRQVGPVELVVALSAATAIGVTALMLIG